MRTINWFRRFAAALLLGLAIPQAAEAGGTVSPPAAANVTRESRWGLPRDHPAIAIGAIVGGIALLVLFAWLAVRIGDKSW